MSVLGKWRIIELPGYDDDDADLALPAYILFEAGGGEFASAASPAPSPAAVTTTPSSSTGTATTRWTTPAAPAGPNSKPTARSRAR